MLFALIDRNGSFVNERGLNPIRDFPTRPIDPTGKGWKWFPVEDSDPGAYDPVTEIKEGPNVTIQAAKVTRIWTVRAKTAQEIDGEKDALLLSEFNGGGMKLLKAFALAWAEREGLTPAQARAAIKAKL